MSIKAGERVLLPAVRNAADDTIIIADGFSCREQIEQQTDRKGLHLAQVLQMALKEKNSSTVRSLPEKKYVDDMKLKNPNKTRNNVLLGLAVAIGVATFLIVKNKKNE